MKNQFFLWLAFIAPWPWRKKLSLTELFTLIVWNILHIWHNYGMFILFFIIIGLTFTIIFNFHRFKSFLLSLFIWSYFTKKWSLFSPFLFQSFSWCRPFILSFLIGLSVEGLCELCWLLLLPRERLYHCFSTFSVDCAGFYLADLFRSFCYLEISFLFSNFV